MPRIDSLTEERWGRFVSDSNQAAMGKKKKHKYPLYEQPFLEGCCTFRQAECTPDCFCRKVVCGGVWTLRPDVEFRVFLSHYCNLWVEGKLAFIGYVEDDSRTGWPTEWNNAVPLLREIRRRWSNWDEDGSSLPSVVSKIRRCYFCNDSFSLIMPTVRAIDNLNIDARKLFTSKLVSQLFYDIAVPFDTNSAIEQKACGYEPHRYGDGEMRKQAKDWLRDNKKSIDDFRKLDDAPELYWSSRDLATTCSRVLDKLFYKPTER
jgi:hypothetical protein